MNLKKEKLSDRLLATISAIFTPYINILAAGVLKRALLFDTMIFIW